MNAFVLVNSVRVSRILRSVHENYYYLFSFQQAMQFIQDEGFACEGWSGKERPWHYS